MEKKEYRKKPVVIQAYQVDKDGEIKTLEGVMQYHKGDYIITGVKGEQYACREDIFKETYELVEPLQNGEREELKEILEEGFSTSTDNDGNEREYFDSDGVIKRVLGLLSQSKKEYEEELVASKLLWERMNEWQKEWRAENPKERELTICDGLKLIEWKIAQSRKKSIFTKEELSYLSWAMNMERFGEDMVGRRPNTSAEEHDILNEKINKELESLTNQKKDI